MKRLARSEAGLLRFVQALVRDVEVEGLRETLSASHKLAPKLGPAAMELVQDTLAKGCILALARHGGWRHEARPTTEIEEVHEGRLWDRHPPPALRFTAWSFTALRFAYTHSMLEPQPSPAPPEQPGLGDRMVAWFLARALRLCPSAPFSLVIHEPLAQLELAGRVSGPPVDWASWLSDGALLLEGLGEAVGRSWAVVEREKMTLTEPAALLAIGQSQQRLLDGLLTELERRERQDLADFLLFAGQLLLPDPDGAPSFEPTELNPSRPLRERTEARRAGRAFCAAIGRLESSLQSARSTRFFDDRYEAAQARLRRWERFGADRARVFRAVGGP